jgi:hypothetical protein
MKGVERFGSTETVIALRIGSFKTSHSNEKHKPALLEKKLGL